MRVLHLQRHLLAAVAQRRAVHLPKARRRHRLLVNEREHLLWRSAQLLAQGRVDVVKRDRLDRVLQLRELFDPGAGHDIDARGDILADFDHAAFELKSGVAVADGVAAMDAGKLLAGEGVLKKADPEDQDAVVEQQRHRGPDEQGGVAEAKTATCGASAAQGGHLRRVRRQRPCERREKGEVVREVGGVEGPMMRRRVAVEPLRSDLGDVRR